MLLHVVVWWPLLSLLLGRTDETLDVVSSRFQMLRDLVPHSDQKRDKASFLLEVTRLPVCDIAIV
jgi:hypothetical protein